MAHEYQATIHWERGGAPFTDRRYSRGHSWTFDGGLTVPGSSAPGVVAPPLSVEKAVDPEEALVASLSSCHMLFFLDFAAREGFVVDDYLDAAAGVMGKNAAGHIAMLRVTLHPRVRCSGPKLPGREELTALHHRAHAACYIANSVNFDVQVEPVIAP